MGNDFGQPNLDDIPSDFSCCCGNPTKLILAPNCFKLGFWIVTCNRNTLDPNQEISLVCPSFMVPKPKVAPRRCTFCLADAELLQTHGTATIGHWYWKCPNRDKDINHKNDHLLRMVTCDAHEAKKIKAGEKQRLPVSHIIKNGCFISVDEISSLNDIQPPFPAWEATIHISDDHVNLQTTPNLTPATILSGQSTPVLFHRGVQHQSPTPLSRIPFTRLIQNTPSPGPTDQTDDFQAQVETVIIPDHDDSVPPNSEDQTFIKAEYQSDNQIFGNGKETNPTINTATSPPVSTRTRGKMRLQNAQSNEEPEGQSSNRAPSSSPVASSSHNVTEDNSEEHTTDTMNFETNGLARSFQSYIDFQRQSQIIVSIHPDSEFRSQITQQAADATRVYERYLDLFLPSDSSRGRSRRRRPQISPYPHDRKKPKSKK